MEKQDREIRDSPFANIGCGVRRDVGEMLELLLTMTDARVEVRQDPARLRACPEPGRRAIGCQSLAGGYGQVLGVDGVGAKDPV